MYYSKHIMILLSLHLFGVHTACVALFICFLLPVAQNSTRMVRVEDTTSQA